MSTRTMVGEVKPRLQSRRFQPPDLSGRPSDDDIDARCIDLVESFFSSR